MAEENNQSSENQDSKNEVSKQASNASRRAKQEEEKLKRQNKNSSKALNDAKKVAQDVEAQKEALEDGLEDLKSAASKTKKQAKKISGDINSDLELLWEALGQLTDSLEDAGKLKKDAKKNFESLKSQKSLFEEFALLAEDFKKITSKDFGGRIKLTGSQISQVIDLLNQTGLTTEQLVRCLSDNLFSLDSDLRNIALNLDKTDSDFKTMIDNLAQSMSDYSGAISGLNASTSGALDSLEDKQKKVLSVLDGMKSDAKVVANLNYSPTNAISNMKAVQNSVLKELSSMQIEFGFDTKTFSDALGKMDETSSSLEMYERKINEELAKQGTKSSDEIAKQVDIYVNLAAAQVAAAKKRNDAMRRIAEDHQAAISIASGGYLELASASKEASDKLKDAFSRLKSGDLVGALQLLKDSRRMSGQVNQASKAMAEGSGDKAMVTIMAAFGKITLVISVIKFLIDLFIQARDQAVQIRKGLIASGGLVGLGLDINANLSYEQIRDQLDKARDGIAGFSKDMFDFNVDSSEITAVVEELGRQGVMATELDSDLSDLRGATKGVFAYSLLMRKSHTEMASTMGNMATMLNMSMDETEVVFADLYRKWAGSRMSIDDFLSGVMETTTETMIFGNRLGQNSELLSRLGKSALFGGKKAVEALKAYTGALDGMSRDKLIGMTEVLGPSEMQRLISSNITSLESAIHSAKMKGQAVDQNEVNRLERLKRFRELYEKGTAAPVTSYKALLDLNDTFRSSALLAYGAKLKGLDYNEFSKVRREELIAATGAVQNIDAIMGKEYGEWLTFINSVAETAGIHADDLAKIREATERIPIVAQATKDDVEKDIGNSKNAATLMLDSEKALKILTEALLNDLYSSVRGIEDMVRKIVNSLPRPDTIFRPETKNKLLDAQVLSKNLGKSMEEYPIGPKDYNPASPAVENVTAQIPAILEAYGTVRDSLKKDYGDNSEKEYRKVFESDFTKSMREYLGKIYRDERTNSDLRGQIAELFPNFPDMKSELSTGKYAPPLPTSETATSTPASTTTSTIPTPGTGTASPTPQTGGSAPSPKLGGGPPTPPKERYNADGSLSKDYLDDFEKYKQATLDYYKAKNSGKTSGGSTPSKPVNNFSEVKAPYDGVAIFYGNRTTFMSKVGNLSTTYTGGTPTSMKRGVPVPFNRGDTILKNYKYSDRPNVRDLKPVSDLPNAEQMVASSSLIDSSSMLMGDQVSALQGTSMRGIESMLSVATSVGSISSRNDKNYNFKVDVQNLEGKQHVASRMALYRSQISGISKSGMG